MYVCMYIAKLYESMQMIARPNHIHIYMCVYVCVCVCVCVCVYLCMYVCMYVWPKFMKACK
jgi:hypothetical protein